MPVILTNGTSVLSGPTPQDEAIVAGYCNTNSIFTDAGLRSTIDTLTSVANNPGVNTTLLSFARARLKAQFFIAP